MEKVSENYLIVKFRNNYRLYMLTKYRYKVRKWFKNKIRNRNEAALIIQKVWKDKHSRGLMSRVSLKDKTEAATKIQHQYRRFSYDKIVAYEECTKKLTELEK